MKKFALIFILIFSLSFFCTGCQKREEVIIADDYIMLSLHQSSNGGMRQSIKFSLNSKRLKEISASMQEELTFRRNLIKEIDKIRNEFLFTYAIKYVSNPIEQYKINQGVILTDVTYEEKGDYAGFEIYFTSSGAWNYYNSNDSQSEDEKKPCTNKGNIFYKKIVNSGIFPFSSQVKTDTEAKLVGEIYRERFLSSAKGLSFENKLREEYHCQYLYDYGSLFQKLNSDAQIQYYGSDKKYHHVWVVEEEKLSKENQIKLSMVQINRGWWIFFAVAVPLLIASICIIVIKINTKRKLKKSI